MACIRPPPPGKIACAPPGGGGGGGIYPVKDVREGGYSRSPGQAEQVVVEHSVVRLDKVPLLLTCAQKTLH